MSMPKRTRNDEYYPVIRGFHLTVPTIFSSWGDAHPLVTGFSKALFSGFATLEEAQGYMEDHGVEQYNYDIRGAGSTTPIKGQDAYYAVANGRKPGVQKYYCGGAEPEVVKFSGACHKHFRTLAQAQAFIADWEEMYACMVKAHIKEELSDCHRPVQMKGTPIPLTLKRQGSDEEDELAHTLERSGLDDA